MIIPDSVRARDDKLIKVIDDCTRSARDRRLRYEHRRRWFLFGNDSTQPVKYNRLMSHTDLVASFLFSPDAIRFSLSPETQDSPLDSEIMEAAADHLRFEAMNSDLVQQFGQAVQWALCYDTMLLKMGWSDARKQVFGRVIDPYSFGVYDEAESSLDEQEAFVHFFRLPRYDAIRRMIRAGKGHRIKDLETVPEGQKEEYPPFNNSLMISMTGGQDITGPVMGQVSTEYTVPTDYLAATPDSYVPFKELWVWDSKADDCKGDYRQFLIAGDDIVIEDSKDKIAGVQSRAGSKIHYDTETNGFFPQEHPFVQITPFPMFDYFWGECHTERLIPLQTWSNKRLEEIDDYMEKQVDPSRLGAGMSGMADEKMTAMGGPGAWVFEQQAGANIQELRPPPNNDLFAEFEKIGELFLEASGLTQTVTGQGSQGVRSQQHAKQLATTGAGRIKKAALALEPALSRMGELLFKLTVHNDTTHLKTAQGMQFLAGQIDGEIHVSVDGHSHSPLFKDDTRELAVELYKLSAIDKESLLKMMNPPGVAQLVDRLRKMEAQKAKEIQLGLVHPDTKAEDEAKRSHHKRGAA